MLYAWQPEPSFASLLLWFGWFSNVVKGAQLPQLASQKVNKPKQFKGVESAALKHNSKMTFLAAPQLTFTFPDDIIMNCLYCKGCNTGNYDDDDDALKYDKFVL